MNSASISMPGSCSLSASAIPSAARSTHTPQVAADDVPLPHAQHDPELLLLLADPLAQFAGPDQDRPDFGRGVTAGRDVGRSQCGEELQFPVVALSRRLRACPTTRGLSSNGRSLRGTPSAPRPLPRLEPVADRLLGQARLGEVVAQQLRLSLRGLRELRFQHLADPPVKLLPLALDQRVVQCVFEQGVLEDVRAAGRPALRVEDLRLRQLGQLRLEGRLVQVRRLRRDSSWLNSRPSTAASWANSRPPSMRSSRAITRSWSVLGIS